MSTVITISGITTDLKIGSVVNAIPVNDLQYTQDKSAPLQSFFVSRKDRVSADGGDPTFCWSL